MVDFKLEISLILCIVDILSLNVVRLFRCLCWTESCLLCSFISNQWWWFNVLIQRVSYCPQHFVLCSYYKHDSMTSPTSLIKLLFGWTQDQSSLAGSTSNILLSWHLLINIPWMPLLQKPQMYPPTPPHPNHISPPCPQDLSSWATVKWFAEIKISHVCSIPLIS